MLYLALAALLALLVYAAYQWWAWRPVRKARAAYESARLERLMAENEARLEELWELRTCPYCVACESPRRPHPCATNADLTRRNHHGTANDEARAARL